MDDLLPTIHINLSCNHRQFFSEISNAARRSGKFRVEYHSDAGSTETLDVVNLRLLTPSEHCELGAQLIWSSKQNSLVSVEIKATRWSPIDPPTYEAYVSEAKKLLLPLLANVNCESHTRRRLCIQSKKSLEPKLPPESTKLFKEFTHLANKSVMHPRDWDRFYYFVRKNRMKRSISTEEMNYLLVKDGFSQEYANRISLIYSHLAAFKEFYR